jgi:hypothetical protein
MPHLPIAQLSEQAPGQQHIDHHPGRQHPHPPLHRAGLAEHGIDHLERHLLGQLAQMTRRERTRSDPDNSTDGRLIQRRGSRFKAVLE